MGFIVDIALVNIVYLSLCTTELMVLLSVFFIGCDRWPLWCGLSFGGPRWNHSLQGDEEAIWQLYLHSSQERHLQVLFQQRVLHLHTQDSLLWLSGWGWPSTLPQWEQSHCSYPGKLCVWRCTVQAYQCFPREQRCPWRSNERANSLSPESPQKIAHVVLLQLSTFLDTHWPPWLLSVSLSQ